MSTRRNKGRERAAQAAKARGIDNSPETMQKDVERLSSIKFFKPLSPATMKEHTATLTLLRAFLMEMEDPDIDTYFMHGSKKHLSTAQWQRYAKWFASRATGRVRLIAEQDEEVPDAIRTFTLKKHMWTAIAALRRLTASDNPEIKAVREGVVAYIDSELTEELGLSTVPREKKVGTLDDFKAVLRAAYVTSLPFRTVEERLAWTCALKLMVYSASRPGEIVQSTLHEELDAVRWGDMQISLLQAPNQPTTLSIVLTIRLLKGMRTKDDAFKQCVLTLDRSSPLICPVVDILALASLQDNILVNKISNLLELLDAPSAATKEERISVLISEEARNRFLFRTFRLTRGDIIVHERSPTLQWLNRYLHLAGLSAGISGTHTAYTWRRMIANALNCISVTAEDRKQLMGHHLFSRIFSSYISRTSGVSTQSVLTGNVNHQNVLEKTIKIASGQPLPTCLSATQRDAVLNQPCIQALNEEVELKRSAFKAMCPNKTYKAALQEKEPAAVEYKLAMRDRNDTVAARLKSAYLLSLKQLEYDDGARRLDDCFAQSIEASCLAYELPENVDGDGVDILTAARGLDLSDINLGQSQWMQQRISEIEQTVNIDDLVCSNLFDFDYSAVQIDQVDLTEAMQQTQAYADNSSTVASTSLLPLAPQSTTFPLSYNTAIPGGVELTTHAEPKQGNQIGATVDNLNPAPHLRVSIIAARRSRLLTLLEAGRGSCGTSAELNELLCDDTLLPDRPFRAALADGHPQNGCGYCNMSSIPVKTLYTHRRKCQLDEHIRSWTESAVLIHNVNSLTSCPCDQTPLQRPDGDLVCKSLVWGDTFSVVKHLSSHIDRKIGGFNTHRRHAEACPFNGCSYQASSYFDQAVHWQSTHLLLVGRVDDKSLSAMIKKQTHYCWACHEHITTYHSWRQHCAAHLKILMEEDDDSIFSVIARGTAIARPAVCPWCLFNPLNEPEEAMRMYENSTDAHSHMQRHLAERLARSEAGDKSDLICPIPRCRMILSDIRELGNHMVERHSIRLFGHESASKGGRAHARKWDGQSSTLRVAVPAPSQRPDNDAEEAGTASSAGKKSKRSRPKVERDATGRRKLTIRW